MCHPSPYRVARRPEEVSFVPARYARATRDRRSSIGDLGPFHDGIRTRLETPPECFGRCEVMWGMKRLWYRFRCCAHIFTGRREKNFVGLLVKAEKSIMYLLFPYHAPRVCETQGAFFITATLRTIREYINFCS